MNFLSPNGNDANTGTREHPWLTKVRSRLFIGIVAVLILSCVSTVHAAGPAFVRSHSFVCGSAASCSDTSQTTTAGNLAAVSCSYGSGTSTTLSVADGGTDTFVGTTKNTSSTNAQQIEWFYVQSLAGGTKTITCSQSGGASVFWTCSYWELSGQSASALDTTSFADSGVSGNSATPSTTFTTAANTTTLAWANCGNTCSVGTCTPNACANGLTDANGDEGELQTNNAGGSTKMAFAQTSGAYTVSAVDFKGAGGAVSPPGQLIFF